MTPQERLIALLGTWSAPPDLPAKLAAVLALAPALAAIAGRGEGLLLGSNAPDPDERRAESRRFVALVAFAAAMLSIAYVASYLRGGPRIVDATTYFLQGRALAHGDLSWTPLEPSASFRGRFLIYREGADGASLGGIFPPGYPLLLAFGFVLGVPMIVGPLLAAALVVMTYQLARALAEEALPELAEPVARAAALLSSCCAALRYHTADTMSHGASALGVTIALTAALRARRAIASGGGGGAWTALAGLATGYVVATRPASAIPIALVAGALVVGALVVSAPVARAGAAARAPRLLVLFFSCVIPGVALLCLSQRAVTGSWFASTQRMYYALSDGPPGCFRWGFGAGTGCLFEHGDFVAARLADGFGLVEAAGTTLRRLHAHLLDVANLEPLALLALVPALARPGSAAIRAATALVVLQVLAYAPFYFDGDYPGGGARFFADALPVEHALVTLGVAAIASRGAARAPGPGRGAIAARSGPAFARGAFALLALALAGFAVHASYEHGALRDRDGGVPMFEPDVLARASVTRGLVFVDTDHGFSLGHDPAARPERGVVVARRRNDARDRMLYDALGRPPTYLYELVPGTPPGPSSARLTLWSPPSLPSLRLEAEAEWPALSQDGGFAAPTWTDACASGGRALVLTPAAPGGRARATIALPVPARESSASGSGTKRRWAVSVFTTQAPSGSTEGEVTLGGERWSWQAGAAPCAALPEKTVELGARAIVTLEAIGGPVGLDRIELRELD